jgi:hypothetical protein
VRLSGRNGCSMLLAESQPKKLPEIAKLIAASQSRTPNTTASSGSIRTSVVVGDPNMGGMETNRNGREDVQGLPIKPIEYSVEMSHWPDTFSVLVWAINYLYKCRALNASYRGRSLMFDSCLCRGTDSHCGRCVRDNASVRVLAV